MSNPIVDGKYGFNGDIESSINNQINNELSAFYLYMNLSNYFSQVTVSYPGTAKYFEKKSAEELEHAKRFMDYQIRRGGAVSLKKIDAIPSRSVSINEALKIAYNAEYEITGEIGKMLRLAKSNNDIDFENFISEFIKEQIDDIAQLARLIVQCERCKTEVDLMHFDKHLS